MGGAGGDQGPPCPSPPAAWGPVGHLFLGKKQNVARHLVGCITWACVTYKASSSWDLGFNSFRIRWDVVYGQPWAPSTFPSPLEHPSPSSLCPFSCLRAPSGLRKSQPGERSPVLGGTWRAQPAPGDPQGSAAPVYKARGGAGTSQGTAGSGPGPWTRVPLVRAGAAALGKPQCVWFQSPLCVTILSRGPTARGASSLPPA